MVICKKCCASIHSLSYATCNNFPLLPRGLTLNEISNILCLTTLAKSQYYLL